MSQQKITREVPWSRPRVSLTSFTGGSGDAPSGQVPVSIGSNGQVAWGSNVSHIYANGSNHVLGPFVNFAAGSNITLAVSSNTMTITSTASGGGGSGSLTVADEGVDLSTAATKLDFVGAGVTATGSGATKTITIAGGGSSTVDPIADIFGTPDTAYEFNTTSLAGLTAVDTPTAEDANTTVPGHYFVSNATNAAGYWRGRSAAVTAPCTVITLVRHNANANYEEAGLLLGPSALSSAFDVLCHGYGSSTHNVTLERWNSNSSYNGTPTINAPNITSPVYFGIKAASDSDVDYYWSKDGYIWFPLSIARNPSLTIAQVAMVIKAENTGGFVAAYDFLRIWNTAKAFPGIA